MNKFKQAALGVIATNAPLLKNIGDGENDETVEIESDEEPETPPQKEKSVASTSKATTSTRGKKGKPVPEEVEADDDSDDDVDVDEEGGKKGKGKKKKKGAAAAADDDDEEKDPGAISLAIIKEFMDLFLFATPTDRLIILIGIIFTVIHGCGFPLLALLFGSMSNAFIQQSIKGFANESLRDNDTHVKIPTFTSLFEKVVVTFENKSDDGGDDDGDADFFQSVQLLTKDEFVEYISLFSTYYVYIGIIVGIATFFQVYCWEWAAENQVYQLRTQFVRQVLRQEMSWFDDHPAGDLTIKLADDIERIREGIGHKFSMVLEYLVTFGIGCGLGAMMDRNLTMILMSTTPLIVAKILILTKIVADKSKLQQQEFGEAGAISAEVLRGIRTVTAFGAELKEMERYGDALEEGVEMAIKKFHMVGVGTGIMYLLIYGSYALAFWYGCTMLLKNEITPGVIFSTFFCASMATFALGNILPFTSNIAVAYGSTKILKPIFSSDPFIDASKSFGKKPKSLNGSIKFHDVTFCYPARPGQQVLSDLTLELPAGKTYGIVGRSGSGKTTILNLLMRFYDPQSGGISIDQYDIKSLNTKWLRNNIGVVAQNPVFQQGTIWENIRAGRKNLHFAEILRASKYACAHSFIKELPEGYNTMIGITGRQISTTQRQCVAIARALVVNPPILILDEATSCLEPAVADKIHSNIRRVRRGRTTIAIAHRLSTIRGAHKILVMRDGEIVEQGAHEQLMEKGGLYANMVADEKLEDKLTMTPHGLADHEEAEVDDEDDFTPDPISKKKPTSEEIVRRAEEIASLPETYPSLWSILEITFEDDWKIMLAGGVGAIIAGMIIPIFSLYYGEIFGTFSKTGDELVASAIHWAEMLVLLAVVAGIGYWMRGLFVNWAGETLALKLRVYTYVNILRQPLGWFDNVKNSPGRLYTRLAVDAPFVKVAVGSRLGTALSALVSLLCAIIITLVFSWRLACLLLIAVPMFVITMWGQVKILQSGQRKAVALMESALRITTRAIQDIWTVQCLSREKDVQERFNDVLEPAFIEGHRQVKVYSTAFAVSETLIFMLLAASFRFGAYLIEIDELTPKSLFKIFFALAFCAVAIGQATSYVPDLTKARLSAALLNQLMNLESTIDPIDDEGEMPKDIQGEIKFQDVQFSYPARPSVFILRGTTFEIPAGAYVGLIGPVGCGKSTILSLLERFYDANDGQVFLDGVDVKTMNVAYLRAQFGVVPQEPNLFNTTIAANIEYGYRHTEEDNEMDASDFAKKLEDLVAAAAEQAKIKDFIESLPEGYNTLVGERGCHFTGGQIQRIAIARALIRNPKILLLDEPTSALDSTDEKLLNEVLDTIRIGRTAIIVSSRPKPIMNTDLVGVLQNGQIIEWGTHTDLAAKDGFYSQFMKMHDD